MISDVAEECGVILVCERCGVKKEVDVADDPTASKGAWICAYCCAEEEGCGCSD